MKNVIDLAVILREHHIDKNACLLYTVAINQYGGDRVQVSMFLPRGACCVTGHRRIGKEDARRLPRALDEAITGLCARGVHTFLCGGAMGFDMLAAERVLILRERGLGVRLHLALPCPGHDGGWPAPERERLARLIARADEVTHVSAAYSAGCMKRRNAFMVAHARYCLCYLRRLRSGSGQTVRMALGAGLPVERL